MQGYEDEYEEEEYELDEDESRADRLQTLMQLAVSHPRLFALLGSSGGSLTLDLFARFNPLIAFLGLGGVLTLGYKLYREDLIAIFAPSAEPEQVEAMATHLMGDYPIYADQSPIAKFKRLIGRGDYRTVEQDDEEESPRNIRALPRNRGVKKPPNVGTVAGQQDVMTYVTDLFLQDRIDIDKYVTIIDHLNNPTRAVTRNDRNIAPKTAPENDGTTQKEATPTGMEDLPPGWTEDKLKMLPGFYIALKNLDRALEAIEVSLSQRNRDFGRNALRKLGKWKETQ